MRNWAGNHEYAASRLHRPATVEQLQELVAAARSVRVLGSRHSFTAIADAHELVSLEGLDAGVAIDRSAGTVSAGSAVRYGELARALHAHGLALHNLASLPHISIGGAVATATHGAGDANGNLATAVAALELVTSSGELVTARRGAGDFDGMVVSLGALGAVTRLTLDVEPAYEVRQHVFEDLRWDALLEHLDAIMGAGYAVSAFTRWSGTVEQVWVKVRSGADVPDELFGARAATEERHPIAGMDPVNATRQRGVPGPWFDRLPHFRMGFTPSAGDELQSEYLVPRRHAAAALDALGSLAAELRPLTQVCELRTVAADRLWLSPQHERDSLGVHFTWVSDQRAVERALGRVEAALAPFDARPHWGKLFLADAERTARSYPRLADFRRLAERLDPRGAFRNAWLERCVLGKNSWTRAVPPG